MKKAVVMLLCAALLFCACQNPASQSGSETVTVGGSTRRDAIESTVLQFSARGDDEVYATITTNKGDIRLVLYPRHAPLAVENFCTLADWGYYNNTLFHRVVKDFMVQAGDAGGTGYEGASIWGTPFDTEATEELRHYSGALCMASAGEQDTHTSQFYIVATPQDVLGDVALEKMRAVGWSEEVVETYRQAGGAPYLDYTDTVFGQVVAGMDVVDAICGVSVEEDGTRPKQDVTIERITVENYPPAWMQVPPSQKPPLQTPEDWQPPEDAYAGSSSDLGDSSAPSQDDSLPADGPGDSAA